MLLCSDFCAAAAFYLLLSISLAVLASVYCLSVVLFLSPRSIFFPPHRILSLLTFLTLCSVFLLWLPLSSAPPESWLGVQEYFHDHTPWLTRLLVRYAGLWPLQYSLKLNPFSHLLSFSLVPFFQSPHFITFDICCLSIVLFLSPCSIFSSPHLITFTIFITFNIFITVLHLPAVAPLILRSAGVLVRCPGVLSCPRAVADTGARPVRRHASTTVLLEHSRAYVTSKSL